MPLGPYDRRKKRSRCAECFKRHLKCSGGIACHSCELKGLACHYNETNRSGKPQITIDNGKQLSVAVYKRHGQGRQSSAGSPAVLDSPGLDPRSFYIYYFDVFLEKNKFSGRGSVSPDVQELVKASGSDTGGYLMDAMLCLGAMEAIKLQQINTTSRRDCTQVALNLYSRSISGLRNALSQEAVSRRKDTVLWTTLFLGLFELMVDPTGYGWLQHIIHGTSHALLATGSQAFRSGFGERFFLQMKVFEVCRAIIFNEPTFLVAPEWMALSSHLRAKCDDVVWRAVDELLDLVALCSTLRVRASTFIHSSVEHSDPRQLTDAVSISEEGLRLRTALETWYMAWTSSPGTSISVGHGFQILALAFHSATRIYLSGVFDYEITHWQDLDLQVPALTEDIIQGHVTTIIGAAGQTLSGTDISPVLVLFPLRVAGARASTAHDQRCIIDLLANIESTFAVADAFRRDLGEVWESQRSLVGDPL